MSAITENAVADSNEQPDIFQTLSSNEGITKERLDAALVEYSGTDRSFDSNEFESLAKDFNMSSEEFANFLGLDSSTGDIDTDIVTDSLYNQLDFSEVPNTSDSPLSRMKSNFKSYDLDGSGYLSKEELQAVVEAGGPDAATAQTLLDNFDGAVFGTIDPGSNSWVGISQFDIEELEKGVNSGKSLEDSIWDNAETQWVARSAEVDSDDSRDQVKAKISAYIESAQDSWGVQDDGLAGLYNDYTAEEIAFIESYVAGEIDPATITPEQLELLGDYLEDAATIGIFEEDPDGRWFKLSPPGVYEDWIDPEFFGQVDTHRDNIEAIVVNLYGEGEIQEDGSTLWELPPPPGATNDISELENPGDNKIENALDRYNDGVTGKKRITRADFVRNGWSVEDARMMQLLAEQVPNKDGHYFKTVDGVTLRGMEDNGWIIVHDDGLIEMTDEGRELGQRFLDEEQGII